MITCEFCAELDVEGCCERLIMGDASWVLIPTLGCFVEGYCLWMPREHYDSFSRLPLAEFASASARVESARNHIAKHYGATIIAEHGSGACDVGAACCSHAHLHLIPVRNTNEVVRAYETVGGSATVLSGLPDLKRFEDQPYMYLSPQPGIHLAWPAAPFRRQFVRRVCAEILGVPALYDWRLYPFTSNMLRTLEVLDLGLTDASPRPGAMRGA